MQNYWIANLVMMFAFSLEQVLDVQCLMEHLLYVVITTIRLFCIARKCLSWQNSLQTVFHMRTLYIQFKMFLLEQLLRWNDPEMRKPIYSKCIIHKDNFMLCWQATICDVAVDPEYQKRGIGRRIVKQLVQVPFNSPVPHLLSLSWNEISREIFSLQKTYCL
jgi:ribosomal protein S18 acetylase RimI-like enzyme